MKVAVVRAPRLVVYGRDIVAALALSRAVLRAPAGKRLAPMLTTVVPMLRREGALVVNDARVGLLVAMSAARSTAG